MKLTGAPTRTGSVCERYGGVRLPLTSSPPLVARKLVVAPSSRVTLRAAFSAWTALSAAGMPGSSTSVRWISGVLPKASPTSPNWLVAKVLVTV